MSHPACSKFTLRSFSRLWTLELPPRGPENQVETVVDRRLQNAVTGQPQSVLGQPRFSAGHGARPSLQASDFRMLSISQIPTPT